MIYFKHCKTIDEVKETYRKLAKEHHPDLGGDVVTMQTINKEYAYVCANILKGSGMSAEETDNELKLSEEYREAIEKIIHLPNIQVEIVGFWIWITGNTYPVRKELHEAKYIFAGKKKAWYYRAEKYKTTGGKKDLDEIRSKYGSKVVNKTSGTKALYH
jgi:hypothetical protein